MSTKFNSPVRPAPIYCWFVLLGLSYVQVYAQIDAPAFSSAEKYETERFTGDRWYKNFSGRQINNFILLERDSLLSISVRTHDNAAENIVVNYYTGVQLFSIPLNYYGASALRGNSKYVYRALAGSSISGPEINFSEYLIRYDLDDNARADTFEFNLDYNFKDNVNFMYAWPVPRRDNLVVVRLNTVDYKHDYTAESGYNMLINTDTGISTSRTYLAGQASTMKITHDGKHLITSGYEVIHQRPKSYRQYYEIWRIQESGLTKIQELPAFQRIRLTPADNEFLLFIEGSFVRRYRMHAGDSLFRTVDAFHLDRPGQFMLGGKTYLRVNQELGMFDFIDIYSAELVKSCTFSNHSKGARSMLLAPRGDIAMIIDGLNTVAAINICGVDQPDYERVHNNREYPQLLPGSQARASLGPGTKKAIRDISIKQHDARTMEIHIPKAEGRYCTIVDITGRMVFSCDLDRQETITIDLRSWPRARYFLSLYSAAAVTQSSFVIAD